MRPAILGACLALLTPPAFAEQASPVRSVSVLVLPGPGLEPGDRAPVQDALLTEAFRMSGEGGAWMLTAFSPVELEQDEGKALREVKRMVEVGKKSYRYLKLPEARATLQGAIRIVERIKPAQCDPRVMAELYFYWARAALDSGDDEAAAQLLTQIRRFDPKHGPDPAVMPPNLVATYDVALEEHKQKASGRARVVIGPGQGTLFADCIQRPVPNTLRGRDGDVFWLAAITEKGTFRGQFELPAGPDRHLTIFSGNPGDGNRIHDAMQGVANRAVTLGKLAAAPDVSLDKVTRVLGVDVLLLAEIREGGDGKEVRLAPYVPGKGVAGKILPVPLAADGSPEGVRLTTAMKGLSQAIASPTLLAAVKAEREARPPPPPEPTDDLAGYRDDPEDEAPPSPPPLVAEAGTPWYKSWWFWTAVGVVVAGGVTAGVILGTADSGSSPSGHVLLTINPP